MAVLSESSIVSRTRFLSDEGAGEVDSECDLVCLRGSLAWSEDSEERGAALAGEVATGFEEVDDGKAEDGGLR